MTVLSSALDKHRPTKVGDGEGGYTEVLGIAVCVWGLVTVHKEKTMILMDALEDVELGDIFVIGNNLGLKTGQYRATGFKEVAGFAVHKQVMVMKVDKPLRPT